MSEATLNNPKFINFIELAKWALEQEDEAVVDYVIKMMNASYRLGYITATRKAQREGESNA